MKPVVIMLATVGAMISAAAPAHDTLTSVYGLAGYLQDLEMRVSHGCKGSPVNSLRIKIPDGVYRVTVENNRNWSIEIKMRKLAKPVPGDGGVMLNETVDEIVWSKPKAPVPASGYFEGFRFRAALPREPGTILFFKTISGCVNGDDKYVDVPATPLDPKAADFGQKLAAFMRSTPGPAPFLILEAPSRPQYPYEAAMQAASGAKP